MLEREPAEPEAAARYFISRFDSEASSEIEISEREYQQLAKAWKGIVAVQAMEEKFDMVMEDYAEVELALLERASRDTTFTELSQDAMIDFLITANRRLLHLLASSRMYLDQSQHGLSEIFGKNSEELAAWRVAASAEYDAVFGYRLMDVLRNYGLHRSLPIARASRRSGLDPGGTIERTVELEVVVDSLLEDESLKASLRPELEARGHERVSLMPPVREFVDSLHRIHAAARTALASCLAERKGVLTNTHERLRKQFGEPDPRWSYVSVLADRGEGREEQLVIFSGPLDRIAKLALKNPCRGTLNRQRVSSSSED